MSVGNATLAQANPTAPPQQPVTGNTPSNDPGTVQPGNGNTGRPAPVSPGANQPTVPAADVTQAKATMLKTADGILQQQYRALGLEYKAPATHLDRVNQAATVAGKLTGKALDDFLLAMESAGKDFGINFGLKRGTGAERKALNAGDAAFKGPDAAQRQQVQQDLYKEYKPDAAANPPTRQTTTAQPTPSTPSTPPVSPEVPTASTPVAADPQLASLAQSILQQLPPPAAGTQAPYTKDELSKVASDLVQKLPPQFSAATAELQEAFAARLADPNGQGVKREELATLIATVLLPHVKRAAES